MAAALDALGPLAGKVQPLFITLDSKRDTPSVIGNYVKTVDPRILGLRGTAEQTAAAAKAFRVYYAVRQLSSGEYAIDHSSFIYGLDPGGRVVQLLTGRFAANQRRLCRASGARPRRDRLHLAAARRSDVSHAEIWALRRGAARQGFLHAGLYGHSRRPRDSRGDCFRQDAPAERLARCAGDAEPRFCGDAGRRQHHPLAIAAELQERARWGEFWAQPPQ